MCALGTAKPKNVRHLLTLCTLNLGDRSFAHQDKQPL